MIYFIIGAVIGAVEIVPIVMCTWAIKGQTKSHFLFIIGGILILVGKYESTKQPQSQVIVTKFF